MKRTDIFITTHLLILLAFILSSMSLQAQYYSKRSVLFGGNSNGFISSIQVMNDTVYAMCAITDTISPYKAIGTLNVYSEDGDIISKHKVDIPDQRFIGNERNCLIQCQDQNLVYGGYSYSDTDHSVIIFKFDKTGSLLWAKTISDSGQYLTLYINAFTKDSFSNYYFVGDIQHKISYDNDIIVGKVDSSGHLIFLKVFDDILFDDSGLGVTINRLNQIIVTGECGKVTTPSGTYHKFYELNSAGNILKYSLGTDTFGPSIYGLIPYFDGGYIMVGAQMCEGQYLGGYFNGCISRFDSNFNTIWARDLGPCGGHNTQFWDVKLLPDSNYLAVGKWYDPVDTTHHDQYGWLVKFTSNGTILWDRRYRGVYNPLIYGDDNQLISVGLFSDNTIIAAGEALDRSAPRNAQQGWLLHLDANGCLPDSNSCGIVSDIPEVELTPDWRMNFYPDPAANHFTLDYQISPDGGYFIVTDVLGREVYKEKLDSVEGSISIPTSAWGGGIYYCTLLSAPGFRMSRAISVIH